METSFREKGAFMVKILHGLDCLIVAVLLIVLVFLYDVEWDNYNYYKYLMFVAAVLSYFVFYSFQLYRSWRGSNLHQELIVIIKAWGSVVGILLFLAFVLKVSHAYSRVVILVWITLTPFVIFFFHLVNRLILRSIRKRGGDLRTALIVGAGDLGVSVAHQIENTPWAGIQVVGFFDDYKENSSLESRDKPILGRVDELSRFLQSSPVDYIYIALPMRAEKKILGILNECRTMGAQIFLVPDLYLFRLFNSTIETLGETLLLNFNPYNRGKRYFDIGFSILVLMASFPLMLIIALAVKLQDGGPVFYGHQRITSTGKPFRCLKFRTMHVGADEKLKEVLAADPKAREEWEKNQKLKDDPRVTSLGKFLRMSSLDELPQFLNVLKGDMSVVGARPIVASELDRHYREYGGLYCSMKPGITGLWQIGERSDTESYEERVKLDTWYVRNHSFWLDMKIIFKTVLSILSRKGAY